MSDNTGYGLISIAVSSLILAIVVLIKRFNGLQFGTCCKIQFSTPRQPSPPSDPEQPVSDEIMETVIVPVVDNIIRRMSKDVGTHSDPIQPE